MINFVINRIHLQLKVVKNYFSKWKLYPLFASQESPIIYASENWYPSSLMPIWKFTFISVSHLLVPNWLKTELISCKNCILWTLFLYMKQKGNFDINYILWKCKQRRYPSRISISTNKSLGSPIHQRCVMYESKQYRQKNYKLHVYNNNYVDKRAPHAFFSNSCKINLNQYCKINLNQYCNSQEQQK